MRFFSTLFCVLLILLCSHFKTIAQCNQAPCPIPMPSVNAQDACVNPSPGALDCYFGATTPDAPVSFPPSWCTTIENNHWFAFVADAPSASFTFNTYGCAVGGAIQVAAFSTNDCVSFQFVSPCIGNSRTIHRDTAQSELPRIRIYSFHFPLRDEFPSRLFPPTVVFIFLE